MKKPSTRRVKAMSAMLLVCAVVGCASFGRNDTIDVAPRNLADFGGNAAVSSASGEKAVIALVLGGGGLRGFAHIGVLQAIEESGIEPAIVVGTSAGSIVGAAYASGMRSASIESEAISLDLFSLMDFTFSTEGIMRGNKIASWTNRMTRNTPIEKFPRRFAAVATDLDSASAVVIDHGPAGNAVRSSSAVPGVNMAVPYAKGHLIDGGITSLVPVRFARAMGADIVIAVDIYCQGSRGSGLGASAMLHRTMHMQSCLLAVPEMAEADILIAPAVGMPGLSGPEGRKAAIEAGYLAARAALATFKDLSAQPRKNAAQRRG
jgi:NTE family protein